MKPSVIGLATILVHPAQLDLSAQATTVFRGIPEIKVTEDGLERRVDSLSPEAAGNLAAVISRIGDKYYWASRENTEMVRLEAGAFITYMALNGAGFVKIIRPGHKVRASLMSPAEARFDYVEHLMIGLRSITYYGLTRVVER